MIKRRTNLVGNKYNRLTVLEYSHTKKYYNHYWLCECECGNKKIIGTAGLKSGHIKSCGCLFKDVMRLKSGESVFNTIYYTYKRTAKKRNLIFLLSKDEFRKLSQQNCYYCGVNPHNKQSREGQYGSFTYNGIDRIDNDRGYELDNCVPCCKICNFAKGTQTQAEFFQLVKRIADKHIILEKEKV